MVALAALALGKLDWQLAGLALGCFSAMAIGNALGSRFFGRMPDRHWRALVVGLIALATLGAIL